MKWRMRKLQVVAIVLPLMLMLGQAVSNIAQATHTPRAYAVVRLTDTNYTGVVARIDWSNPSIRDSAYGFSAEVLWIGEANTHANYIEVGWRRTSGSSNRLYWGYVDAGGQWHGPNWLGADTRAHWFRIEHNASDNRWHVYVDNQHRGSASLGVSSGSIDAGGEVTDLSSTQHNAMGRAGFLDLGYKRNYQGYYRWNGWNEVYRDYSYQLRGLGSDAFQNDGYNP